MNGYLDVHLLRYLTTADQAQLTVTFGGTLTAVLILLLVAREIQRPRQAPDAQPGEQNQPGQQAEESAQSRRGGQVRYYAIAVLPLGLTFFAVILDRFLLLT